MVWLGDPPPAAVIAPEVPLPLTIAVTVRSFEARRLDEKGVVDRVAGALKQSRMFQAVMYPVPEGASPLWELQILARDALEAPESNVRKAFLAEFFLPLAFFTWLETEYRFEFEALLVRRQEIVRSYASQARILNRYQVRANDLEIQQAAAELVVDHIVRELLAALRNDFAEIQAANAG